MRILEPVSESENSTKNRVRLIYKTQRNKFSNAYMSFNSYINKNHKGVFEDFIIKYCEIFVAVQYFGELKVKE